MKFNKIWLFGFTTFLLLNANAQARRGKHSMDVISVCTSLKDSTEKWSDWSEKTEVELTIKID